MKFDITINIAGLFYHYKKSFPDRFYGYVKAEPDNEMDPNAIGIYNEYDELVGYIPRNGTDLIRAWANSDLSRPMKCIILLNVIPSLDIYSGNVRIFAEYPEEYKNSPMSGKRIYTNTGNGYSIDLEALNAFGAIRDSRLNMQTDYVIYKGAPRELVLEKLNDPRYKFQLINVDEFFRSAIPESMRDSRFYGKLFTLDSSYGTILEYIEKFLLWEGATVNNRFLKSKTNSVIQIYDGDNEIVDKARENNKEVIKARDLMPEIYDAIIKIDGFKPELIESASSYNDTSSMDDDLDSSSFSSNRNSGTYNTSSNLLKKTETFDPSDAVDGVKLVGCILGILAIIFFLCFLF